MSDRKRIPGGIWFIWVLYAGAMLMGIAAAWGSSEKFETGVKAAVEGRYTYTEFALPDGSVIGRVTRTEKRDE